MKKIMDEKPGRKITRKEAREHALRSLREREERLAAERSESICDACDTHEAIGELLQALKDILSKYKECENLTANCPELIDVGPATVAMHTMAEIAKKALDKWGN
jgi:hypothetical protein